MQVNIYIAKYTLEIHTLKYMTKRFLQLMGSVGGRRMLPAVLGDMVLVQQLKLGGCSMQVKLLESNPPEH